MTVGKCPQCGGNCIQEYDYSTNEVFFWCNRCGYRYEYSLQKDDNGNVILDLNEMPLYKSNETFGMRVVHIECKDGTAVNYHLDKPYDEEIKTQFLKDISNKRVNKEGCYFTVWDYGNKSIISVYGDIPDLFLE